MQRVHPAPVTEFIARMDAAVARTDVAVLCEEIKQALEDIAAHAAAGFPGEYFEGSRTGYARRLLHRCPNASYSVMVMVWGPGQGSAVHDHAGKWCVEGVVQGAIQIDKYDFAGDPSTDEVAQLMPAGVAHASVGDVGILVPPNEYHAINNPHVDPAVTIHVYEGEMLWCHTFHPRDDGGYQRERCHLTLTGEPESQVARGQ